MSPTSLTISTLKAKCRQSCQVRHASWQVFLVLVIDAVTQDIPTHDCDTHIRWPEKRLHGINTCFAHVNQR